MCPVLQKLLHDFALGHIGVPHVAQGEISANKLLQATSTPYNGHEGDEGKASRESNEGDEGKAGKESNERDEGKEGHEG